MNQISLADCEYSNRRRKTKRDNFLETMNQVIPWAEWVSLILPYYPSGKRGRPTIGIEVMLRMYLLQNWFNLSDEAVEDAIYDSYSFRNFMGLNFFENQAPDATTLCKFRKLLDDNNIAAMIFENINDYLDKQGKIMHGGSIVDATIINAPTSTKNAAGKRDPEMHQTKKGNQWYFGERLHTGVDAGTGYIHSCEVTAANVSEREVVPRLIRKDDYVVYGDAAYSNIQLRQEIQSDPHLSRIDWRTNLQKPYRKNVWKSGHGTRFFKKLEYQKSRVRCKVEYVFFVIKRIFGYSKVRYRGLRKNRTQALTLCTLANIYMLAQSSV